MSARLRVRHILAATTGAALACGLTTAYAATSAPLQSLEDSAMRRLAEVQASGATLAAFSSDGCSGGMSAGWQHISQRFPAFAESYGAIPPWEACCVAHDRAYWEGATRDGYAVRRRADEALRRCVIEAGTGRADEFSERSGLPQQRIRELFAVAAEMMFAAVRAGGGPCTGLPWRWGYGWPDCPLLLQTDSP